MRKSLTIISAFLAGVVFLGGVFSFINPISESQTRQRIGDPQLERNLFVSLADGMIGIKLGVPVQAPYRATSTVHRLAVNFTVMNYGIIDLPGLVSGYRLYTVSISLWFLLGIFLALPLASWWCGPVRRARRKRRGGCESCGYDLRGNLSGACPECGSPVKQVPALASGASSAAEAEARVKGEGTRIAQK